MGYVILVNDVVAPKNGNLLQSDFSSSPDYDGTQQSSILSRYLVSNFPGARNVISSDAALLSPLIALLRRDLRQAHFKLTDALRERDFGVLNLTTPDYNSEIFTKTRICPEEGESLSQCRNRAMNLIHHYDLNYPKSTNIFISHSFLCQIVSNCLKNEPITNLTDFWFAKGSVEVFKTVPHFKLIKSENVLNPYVSNNRL